MINTWLKRGLSGKGYEITIIFEAWTVHSPTLKWQQVTSPKTATVLTLDRHLRKLGQIFWSH